VEVDSSRADSTRTIRFRFRNLSYAECKYLAKVTTSATSAVAVNRDLYRRLGNEEHSRRALNIVSISRTRAKRKTRRGERGGDEGVRALRVARGCFNYNKLINGATRE